MRRRWAGWGALGLVLLSVGGPQVKRSDAQSMGMVLGEMQTPRIPRQGAWAEVLSVTPKWLVIQNADGQQFPVAFEDVDFFLMRWPTTPDRLDGQSLAEATGVSLGSNQIQTDHIDVYEGAARSLVTPTVQTVVGMNRVFGPLDIDQMNYGFVMPMDLEELNMPSRLHVVGPVVNANPIQIGGQGNSVVSVVSPADGITISQITPGTPSLVRRGDWVYFVAEETTPRSLLLSQLVVYKKTPPPR